MVMEPPETQGRMRNARWVIAVLCAAVLIAVFAASGALGADCGDAIDKDGSEAFQCNTAAYLVMAAGFVALAGLVGTVAWAAIEGIIGRRNRSPR
jgi:hypothetical protein